MKETQLNLTPDGFKTWRLTNDFTQEIKVRFRNGYCNFPITVPKGFRTDLASIPRIFWMILPPFGRYSQAAVIHDYLYSIKYPRDLADKIFYESMLRYGTYKWKAKIMYYAVRIFGKTAWKR